MEAIYTPGTGDPLEEIAVFYQPPAYPFRIVLPEGRELVFEIASSRIEGEVGGSDQRCCCSGVGLFYLYGNSVA